MWRTSERPGLVPAMLDGHIVRQRAPGAILAWREPWVGSASPVDRWPASELVLEREDGGWRVTFDLPGVEQEDVHLEVSGSQLRVRAEQRRVAGSASDRAVAYRRIERLARIPDSVDAQRVTATWRDGMLEIVLPQSRAGRRIPITGQRVPVVERWLDGARHYVPRLWRTRAVAWGAPRQSARGVPRLRSKDAKAPHLELEPIS